MDGVDFPALGWYEKDNATYGYDHSTRKSRADLLGRRTCAYPPGEIVIVPPGEQIPVTGTVIAGHN
jgi:hypothetical protein